MKKKIGILLILALCCALVVLWLAYASKNKKALAYEKNQVVDHFVNAKNTVVDWLVEAKDTVIDIFAGENSSKAP